MLRVFQQRDGGFLHQPVSDCGRLAEGSNVGHQVLWSPSLATVIRAVARGDKRQANYGRCLATS